MRLLALVLLVSGSYCSYAQFDPNYRKSSSVNDEETSPLNFGLGIGLNYGGLGGRLELVPQKNVAIFGGVGFNFHKAGFNVGVKAKAAADKKVSPMVQFMYGYNAVIVVVDAAEYNKTYYGPTLGGGIELKVGQNQNFMEFALLIPIRAKEFSDDIQDLRNIGIEMTEPLPFAISAGYHFKF